jgi:hypothetical protein
MDTPKYIEYDGLRFCRDDKTGYYLNSTIRKRLHRYVWEQEVGAVPAGCQIHHIDGNKANNDIANLAILTSAGHQRLHGREIARKEKSRENIKKAQQAAPAWHHSAEGRVWHSKHMQGFKQPRVTKVCTQCGAEFLGTKYSRFCSNKCKSKWRRDQGLDDIEKVCEWCGKPYVVSKYAKQKYCSMECQHKAHVGWSKRRKSGA